MEIVIVAVVVGVLWALQVRRRRSPLQRPGEPRETHGRGEAGGGPEAGDADR